VGHFEKSNAYKHGHSNFQHFMLVICPRDTPWEPCRYSQDIMKFFFEKNLTPIYTSHFFSIYSCDTKSGDRPPKDLAKSNYKSNRQLEKIKNVTGCWWTTLIYQLNMEISKEAGYKYSQIFQISWGTPNIFTKNMAHFFGDFSKNCINHVARHLFFIAKWRIFATQKNAHL